MKRLTSATILATLLLSVGLYQSAMAASPSASMYLTPSSSTVVNGSSVTISIYEDSGSEPVNTAEAKFTYPTNLLQYVSINNSSAFNIVAQNSVGSGSVDIQRGAMPAVTGAQLIASVTFQAIANSGTATLAVDSSSSVFSANTNGNILATRSGTSVTLQAQQSSSGSTSNSGSSPAPSSSNSNATSKPNSTAKSGSASKPSSSTANNTALSPTPTPAPAKPKIPPAITDIVVKNIGTRSVTINWTTSTATTSEIDYGINTKYGFVALDNTLAATHNLVLNSPLINPDTTYHFVIKSTDAAGSVAASTDTTFTTTGATLIVTILDQSTHKPIKGALVRCEGKFATTSQNGIATLSGFPLGTATVVVTVHNSSTSHPINITKDRTSVSLSVYEPGASYAFAYLVVVLLLLGATGVVVYLRFVRPHLKARSATQSPYTPNE